MKNMSSTVTVRAANTTDIGGSIDYLLSVFFEHGDERTKNWFLSSSPWPLFAILAFYLFFCLYAGPKYMRNRKPFELRNTLLIYNAFQVALSCVMFYEVSLNVRQKTTFPKRKVQIRLWAIKL